MGGKGARDHFAPYVPPRVGFTMMCRKAYMRLARKEVAKSLVKGPVASGRGRAHAHGLNMGTPLSVCFGVRLVLIFSPALLGWFEGLGDRVVKSAIAAIK